MRRVRHALSPGVLRARRAHAGAGAHQQRVATRVSGSGQRRRDVHRVGVQVLGPRHRRLPVERIPQHAQHAGVRGGWVG